MPADLQPPPPPPPPPPPHHHHPQPHQPTHLSPSPPPPTIMDTTTTTTPSSDSPRLPTSSTSSPEFEFLLLANTPSPSLLTADELFLDGFLLPLHHLSLVPPPPPPPPPHHEEQSPDTSNAPPPPQTHHPKKWMDLFKVTEKSLEELRARRLRQPRDSAGSAAELNINIWPFSRSRSAGNAGTNINIKPRLMSSNIIAGHRKASSAPCSRSNSRGESTKQTQTTTTTSSTASTVTSNTKKWMPSNGRVTGIHLGRANPVWKLRRKINVSQLKENKAENNNNNVIANARKGSATGGGNASARVLNFNVNTCIGYSNQVSCSVDHVSRMASGSGTAGRGAGGGGDEGGGGGECQSGNNRVLFNLRTIFSKKIY